MRSFASPLDGFGLNGGGFSPASLFAFAEPGAWYDPSDLSTMFQDDAGTTPVTAAGQAVGMIRDKSGRGNHATQATAGFRPLYQIVSGLPCLVFGGTDDFLVTPTITPATDKAQVFAGVRKLSDAAQAAVLELTDNYSGGAGRISLQAPVSAAPNYFFGSRGTAASGQTVAGFAAPDSSVLTGIGDIGADLAQLRRNGALIANPTTDQGTGGYTAGPVYIGMRGGTSLPFNGNLYGLIVRFGPSLATTTIAATERFIAGKTGVTL